MIYVALLRGINVGGNNKVEMKKLKQTFERLGLESVQTYIASGNVIFKSSKSSDVLTKQIEQAIERDFNIAIKVLLVDTPTIAGILKKVPAAWANGESMKCDVMFLWDEIDTPAVLKEFPVNKELEDVRYLPGAVIWRIDRADVTKSKMTKIIGTALYKKITIRNINTTRKLYELMQTAS